MGISAGNRWYFPWSLVKVEFVVFYHKSFIMANMFGTRKFIPKPPEKGSFPLDHEGECKKFMLNYMKCLRNNENNNTACRDDSKEYFECRMQRNLMKREDFNKLGYHEDIKSSTESVPS